MATLKINNESGILEVHGNHKISGFVIKSGKKLTFPRVMVIVKKDKVNEDK